MQIEIQKQGGQCSVKLAGDVTLDDSLELKRKLLDAVSAATEIEVDVSQVSDIDTAGFQLLILAKRESVLRQKKFRLVKHSQPVVEIMVTYNLASYFGDPLVLPATIS
jgi:anti-anti-sigma factor